MAKQSYLSQAKTIIDSVRGKSLTVEERGHLAVEVAALLLNEARQDLTVDELMHQEQVGRMVEDPKAKALLTAFTDQCFRSKDPKRATDQLIFILKKFGIPDQLPWGKKLGLHFFKWTGPYFPSTWISLIEKIIHKEMYRVIVPGEENKFRNHLEKRKKEEIRVNLNHLGEAILGEEEAQKRLKIYLEDLEKPEVEYISVKISTLYSQINLIAAEQTLTVLAERLRLLYRAALENKYVDRQGNLHPKFVNLDMEEYRDLHLTVELFKKVLDEPEFLPLSAGIVLQSYLPDSYLIQQELTQWSRRRIERGGVPVKIRLVKGANLAMEKVEASLQNWNEAPYLTKMEVDANFKKMIGYGTLKENIQAVRLGIGSHNPFDIAYALLLRSEKELEHLVEFEMLEGMAEPLRRAVQAVAGQMLLYCPVASKEELEYAIAYLVRRLDENTAPENFLRYAFSMIPGSKIWEEQKRLFLESCAQIGSIESHPRREQNRFFITKRNSEIPFQNEPDTDWSQQANREWAEEIVQEWGQRNQETIPLVINGQLITDREHAQGVDPSYPNKTAYLYSLATQADLDQAFECALKAQETWKQTPIKKRSTILGQAAEALRKHRKDLIGAMLVDTAKPLMEADTEVSEAIDFAEYYRRNGEEFYSLLDIAWEPKGTILVASPWNFPCSIPASGIFASLIAGNVVIFKPAPEAVLVGWELVKILWEAGIPKEVLQFFTCDDETIGSQLIKDPRLSSVILTGGTSTAQKFLQMKPGIDLMAETGGKNSIIVTAMADRDLAVKSVIQSAFGYAGQKCSACSLLICEKEVYDDSHFREMLKDAAMSLKGGIPWNVDVKVNPLIRSPGETLQRGLTSLEEGEEWLLQPRQDSENPLLWTPGIKLGVKAGNFTHQNELFGPVLGVMKADNLEHALELANGTPYGLTAGLQSLDEREHERWVRGIQAGNCYINRGITGAIVQRQPFGGCKKSHFGKGFKAGGSNYLVQMMRASQILLPEEGEALEGKLKNFAQQIQKILGKEHVELWQKSLENYFFYWKHYFSQDHDPSRVLGQDNILRYVPLKQQILRIQSADEWFDALRAKAAAMICNTDLEISCPDKRMTPRQNFGFITESDEKFLERIGKGKRIRFLSDPDLTIKKGLTQKDCLFFVEPVLANGRLELLNYLREVSLSFDYHRYGYLGIK